MIKCISYIDENLANNLSQEVLAKKLAISTSYLSKLFQKELGKSPGEYIRQRRLDEAKHLIQCGVYTITQVSDLLGYCSVTYFSTEFKKYYGVTPREYSKSVSR